MSKKRRGVRREYGVVEETISPDGAEEALVVLARGMAGTSEARSWVESHGEALSGKTVRTVAIGPRIKVGVEVKKRVVLTENGGSGDGGESGGETGEPGSEAGADHGQDGTDSEERTE